MHNMYLCTYFPYTDLVHAYTQLCAEKRSLLISRNLLMPDKSPFLIVSLVAVTAISYTGIIR